MKQYLMLCDEEGRKSLEALFRREAVQFLEVQGMGMGGQPYNLMVTPIMPPVPQAEVHTSATVPEVQDQPTANAVS